MAEKTTYLFLIRDEDEDPAMRKLQPIARIQCDSDAQAELEARYLSERNGGRLIHIRRGKVTWHVSCGYIPQQNPNTP